MRNPEFIADIAKSAGALDYNVDIQGEAAIVDMTVAAPKNAAKLIGDVVRTQQRFQWLETDVPGHYRGVIDITVAGAPVTANAEAKLRPLGSAESEASYQGQAQVRIPLLGKKLEAQVEPVIATAFVELEQRINDWLSGETS